VILNQQKPLLIAKTFASVIPKVSEMQYSDSPPLMQGVLIFRINTMAGTTGMCVSVTLK